MFEQAGLNLTLSETTVRFGHNEVQIKAAIGRAQKSHVVLWKIDSFVNIWIQNRNVKCLIYDNYFCP